MRYLSNSSKYAKDYFYSFIKCRLTEELIREKSLTNFDNDPILICKPQTMKYSIKLKGRWVSLAASVERRGFRIIVMGEGLVQQHVVTFCWV